MTFQALTKLTSTSYATEMLPVRMINDQLQLPLATEKHAPSMPSTRVRER